MKVFITGASKGIGLYLLNEFHKQGYDVFGTTNTSKPGNELKEYFSKVNVQNFEEVSEWVNGNLNEGDKVILINGAGINYNSFAHKADVDKWAELIDVNLIGSYRCIRAVLPHMRSNGFGRIINLGSVVAQKGIPGTSAYAASKAALTGLSKTIALENANKGITVNTINLGYFNAGMISGVPSALKEEVIRNTPKGRLGEPGEILNTIEYLIKTDFITGTSIDLNGGYY